MTQKKYDDTLKEILDNCTCEAKTVKMIIAEGYFINGQRKIVYLSDVQKYINEKLRTA